MDGTKVWDCLLAVIRRRVTEVNHQRDRTRWPLPQLEAGPAERFDDGSGRSNPYAVFRVTKLPPGETTMRVRHNYDEGCIEYYYETEIREGSEVTPVEQLIIVGDDGEYPLRKGNAPLSLELAADAILRPVFDRAYVK